MEYRNIFKLNIDIDTGLRLVLLALLPNLLSMINLPTIFGFKIHSFQFVVFIAAAIYGPIGGAISGSIGSIFSAVVMNNPYIIIGNLILGFMVGFFMRFGFGMIKAVIAAFVVQLPWLYLTDIYLIGMSSTVVYRLIIALLISNMVWAILAKFTTTQIKQVI